MKRLLYVLLIAVLLLVMQYAAVISNNAIIEKNNHIESIATKLDEANLKIQTLELANYQLELNIQELSRSSSSLETIPLPLITEPVSIPIEAVQEQAPSIVLFDVPLSDELQIYIHEQCVLRGIESHYKLIFAVIKKESTYNPNAVSKSGARGLMQIMPSNLKWLKAAIGTSNLFDPKQNIAAGVYILSGYLLRHDIHRSLMCYNLGEGGAATKWKNGICTTSYSRSVIGMLDGIHER